MALSNTPVLPADYDLFDWNDWPDSFAALVSGGPTSEFEKECWNAIVTKLAEALEDGGLSWDSKYTTAENALITEEYGDLYAAAINSIRHNIDHPVPLDWKWAKDRSFRGYIGREDFKGVDAYGEDEADDVYPEYIIELVRRLNLLLEIMRCDGNHVGAFDAADLTATDSHTTIRQASGFEIGNGSGVSFTTYLNTAIHAGFAAQIIADLIPASTDYLTLNARPGSGVYVSPVLKSVSTDCTIPRARLGSGSPTSPVTEAAKTSYFKPFVFYGWPAYVEAKKENNSITDSDVTAKGGEASPVSGSDASKTSDDTTVRAAGSICVQSIEIARTYPQVTARPADGLQVKSQEHVNTPADATVTPGQSAQIKYIGAVEVPYTKVTIYSAWLPPIWVDGGLWIRQSHGVTQNEIGELVIM